MARYARVVVPGIPYHVTHRGNRCEPVFFSDEQREAYRRGLAHYGTEYGLAIWAYCLMSNHIHLLAVPARNDSMALTIGRAHNLIMRAGSTASKAGRGACGRVVGLVCAGFERRGGVRNPAEYAHRQAARQRVFRRSFGRPAAPTLAFSQTRPKTKNEGN